jgi:hypothetical protein
VARYYIELIEVEGASGEDAPEYIVWRDQKLKVKEVAADWWDRGGQKRGASVDTETGTPDAFWSRQRSRHYFEIMLEDGRSYYIYFDGRKDEWVMEQEI